MMADSGLWCQRQIHLVVHGPDTDHSRTFAQPYVRVGTDPGSDLVLKQREGIQRRCVYLHATDDGLYAVDLRGQGEGAVNGWLEYDQSLTIGPYRIGCRLADSSLLPGADKPDLQAKRHSGRGYPRLQVMHRGQLAGQIRLRRPLEVLGNRHPSTLRIVNKYVSSCHCALYWQGEDVWVVDLLSRNQCRIDGRAIQAARLAVGNSLRLHQIELVYVGLSDGATQPAPHDNSDGRHAMSHSTGSTNGDNHPASQMARLAQETDRLLSARRQLEAERRCWAQEQLRMHEALRAEREELATLLETLRDERMRCETLLSASDESAANARATIPDAARPLPPRGDCAGEQCHGGAEPRSEEAPAEALADPGDGVVPPFPANCEGQTSVARPARGPVERTAAGLEIQTAASTDFAAGGNPRQRWSRSNDEAKLHADRLSHEVCDRLVLRGRPLTRRIGALLVIVLSVVLLAAAFYLGGMQLLPWLK
jgi:hypothetical protein